MEQYRCIQWTRAGLLAGGIVIWLGVAAQAYERYQDGCNAVGCHGDFTGADSPKGTVFPSDSKHEMHRGMANMDTECDLCHTTGDARNPFTGSSDGTVNNTGYGCAGCHGRDYGGAIGVIGAGLRAHHAGAGVTFCAVCHPSDPTPLSEDVLPPYYGTVDTLADDPCNTAPDRLENWSLDLDNEDGLDNDGDGLYDENDPDCAAPICRCGDLNGSGAVELSDFAIFAGCFNQPVAGACVCSDHNGDDKIDLSDFSIFATVFGAPWNGQAPPNCQ